MKSQQKTIVIRYTLWLQLKAIWLQNGSERVQSLRKVRKQLRRKRRVYIYVYIYIYRERERHTHTHTHTHTHIYA
jgi:uncharacterized membrane protein